MNQCDRFAAAEARERIERHGLSGAELHRLPHALIRGWDYIGCLGEIDPPNGGLWRTPHFDPLAFYDNAGVAPLGMFEGIASPDDLYARNWRLLRIFPDAADWRSDREGSDPEGISGSAETGRHDIFAKHDDEPIAHRDHFITSLLGHSLRDHTEFVFELLREEPELGELVLHKRFEEALVRDPEWIDRPWPASVRRRWGGKDLDFLPPFVHAVLVAEFQRLAHNDCSQIALSYFGDGAEASLASTVKACRGFQKMSNLARPAHEIYDNAIADMIDMAPFQTLAL